MIINLRSHPHEIRETLPARAPALPGMPTHHDAARTGELPVSGPICQTNRSTGTRQSRPVRLGKWCSAALDAGRDARGPLRCPHWRISGVRRVLSDGPNGLEHANHCPSLSGSAALVPLMRAGMPTHHDGFSTGESPVSAGACQPNRTDWNTPITAHPFREVLQ